MYDKGVEKRYLKIIMGFLARLLNLCLFYQTIIFMIPYFFMTENFCKIKVHLRTV